MTDRRPRLGATVRFDVRGERVEGVLVRRDARKPEFAPLLKVVTSDVNDPSRQQSCMFPEEPSIPLETVSEPSPDSWVILRNLDAVPTIYAMADDEAGIRAWLAANNTATIQCGDYAAMRYGDMAD